jgi:hypothetical protein
LLSSNFINKLLDQSLAMKISLSASVVYHISFSLFKQYHLRYQHKNYNGCAILSNHYCQNIPFLNILFYINSVYSYFIVKLTDKKHKDVCLLLKSFKKNSFVYDDSCINMFI